jgi:hypothetical protein
MRPGVHGITAAHLVNVDDDHHHPSVEPMGSHWGGRADRDRDLCVPWRNTSRCAHHRLFILAELPERPRNDCDPWRPVEPRWRWRIYREFRTSCTLHRGLRSCVHEDPFHGAPRALPCGRCRDRSSRCRRGAPWRGRQSGGRIANRPHAVGSLASATAPLALLLFAAASARDGRLPRGVSVAWVVLAFTVAAWFAMRWGPGVNTDLGLTIQATVQKCVAVVIVVGLVYQTYHAKAASAGGERAREPTALTLGG